MRLLLFFIKSYSFFQPETALVSPPSQVFNKVVGYLRFTFDEAAKANCLAFIDGEKAGLAAAYSTRDITDPTPAYRANRNNGTGG